MTQGHASHLGNIKMASALEGEKQVSAASCQVMAVMFAKEEPVSGELEGDICIG